MARITIEIDDSATRQALGGMLLTLENPQPALDDIGEYVLVSTKDRFPKGVDPTGKPWAPNRPTTLARKKGKRPLIGESGRLGREIIKYVSDTSVEVGSALVYAAVMQGGAEQGQFGTTSRGGPIPWGRIPARVFLGLSQTDVEAVLDIVEEHLTPAG